VFLYYIEYPDAQNIEEQKSRLEKERWKAKCRVQEENIQEKKPEKKFSK